ncbi:MAG: hypothetical protein IPO97_02985 [Sphingomonadales bacterium]|nr:hypothetical protein [Sphingomonadales bacterium]
MANFENSIALSLQLLAGWPTPAGEQPAYLAQGLACQFAVRQSTTVMRQ